MSDSKILHQCPFCPQKSRGDVLRLHIRKIHNLAALKMPEQVNVSETAMFYKNVELQRIEAMCFQCCREIPIRGKERTVETATRACEAHFCKPSRLDCKKNATLAPTVAPPLTHGPQRDFLEFQRLVETKYPLIKQSGDEIVSFNDRIFKFMRMRESHFNANKKDIIEENEQLKERIRVLEMELAGTVRTPPVAAVVAPVVPPVVAPVAVVKSEPVVVVRAPIPPIVKSAPVRRPAPPPDSDSDTDDESEAESVRPPVVVALPAAPAKPVKKIVPKCRRVLRSAQAMASDDSSDEETPVVRTVKPKAPVSDDSSDEETPVVRTVKPKTPAVELPETVIAYYYSQTRECEEDHGEDDEGNAIDCDCDLSSRNINEDEIVFREFMAYCKTTYGWSIAECETKCVPLWTRLVNMIKRDSDYRDGVNLAMMGRGESATIWDWVGEFVSA